MRDDPYILNSKSKEKQRKFTGRTDIRYKQFISQLKRMKNNRDMMPSRTGRNNLLDLNCWQLLFHGYPHIHDKRLAFQIVEELGDTINTVDEEKFNENTRQLYTIYNFDIKSFQQVWEYQHNIKRLLHQIIQPQYFIGNKFAPKHKRIWKPHHKCTCTPTRHDTIPLPKLHTTLDGLIFPVIITKNHNNYKIQHLQTTNFGDAHYITDNNQIIDCIRINNFWQTQNHLKQRLAFTFLAQTDYDEAPMIICNNMKDIQTGWKMLNANPDQGILIRSLGDNLYKNYWLILNRKSTFVCGYIKYGYSMRAQNVKKGFMTLDGQRLGNMGYKDDVLQKMMWLDDFDIDRFKKVVWQDG